mmetsp:Transcript_88194/g.285473  ORF Transcript_88194/g.285473 Transcript_88194/m.285473 type:complete len:223 (-) Transcript_88194:184-852(-)
MRCWHAWTLSSPGACSKRQSLLRRSPTAARAGGPASLGPRRRGPASAWRREANWLKLTSWAPGRPGAVTALPGWRAPPPGPGPAPGPRPMPPSTGADPPRDRRSWRRPAAQPRGRGGRPRRRGPAGCRAPRRGPRSASRGWTLAQQRRARARRSAARPGPGGTRWRSASSPASGACSAASRSRRPSPASCRRAPQPRPSALLRWRTAESPALTWRAPAPRRR